MHSRFYRTKGSGVIDAMNGSPGNEANLKNSWPRLSEKFPFGLKDFSTEIYFIKLQRLSIPNMDCSENI